MHDATDNIPRTQFPDATRRAPRSGGAADRVGIGAMPLNERPYRRLAEPVRAMPRTGERGRDDDEPGYVIHLPVRVGDLAAATMLARTVAISLGFLPELDAGETTVSTADDQNNRHRVFCDLLLPDRSRCPQRYDHRGPCGEPPGPPEQRPASGSTSGP